MKSLSKLMAIVILVAMLGGCAAPQAATTAPQAATTGPQSATTAPQATSAPANTSKVFTLGLVSPLTGSGATSGATQANAVMMAVDEINKAGGINGTLQINLISEDDEGTPAKSVAVTQKLVNEDHINAMIGALNSSCTLANMKVTQAAGIPQITPSSSNVTIVQQGDPFIFRMTATDATHANTLLKYAKSKGITKIAMMYESSDFGTGAFKLVSSLVANYGITIVDSEVYNSGETDFSVRLTKIKDAKPDTILLWGYYTEAALIAKQVQQYSIGLPIIGTGYNSPALIQLGGDAVNGIIFTTAFTPANPDPKVQDFDKKYTALYKMSYDQNAPQAYDTVYIIADAVTRMMKDGKDWSNGQLLRDYIAATKDFNGVTGITNFSANGDMVKDLMVVQIQAGKQTIVPWNK